MPEYIDTHCHLNFSRLRVKVETHIADAAHAGIRHIVVPGTDIQSSEMAVEQARKYEGVYAAVGIHPHHVFSYQKGSENETQSEEKFSQDLLALSGLLRESSVVAVGEVGLDRHTYRRTKYDEYRVTEDFFTLQKKLLIDQVYLAISMKKSLILHNREAGYEICKLLETVWDPFLVGRSVFHCAEPDKNLLLFARKHGMYLGVDGDITYNSTKQQFWKEVTDSGRDLSFMVLETDAPFLLPEPFRTRKEYPNVPARIADIAIFIAELFGKPVDYIAQQTSINARNLFLLSAKNTNS